MKEKIINTNKKQFFTMATLDTPLGEMLAVADASALHLLDFKDSVNFDNKVAAIKRKYQVNLVPGDTKIITQIRSELSAYFQGENLNFTTPVHLSGSTFQNHVWSSLKSIMPGKTFSYLELAKSIHKPTAFRAVALANAANTLAIIIPCHRIINANGKPGGYAGGITRKQWLLAHEKKLCNNYF